MHGEQDLQTKGYDAPRIFADPTGLVQVTEGQCDCACAPSVGSWQPFVWRSGCRYHLDTVSMASIARHGQEYVVAVGKSGPVVLNRAAWMAANWFCEPHLLNDVPKTWTDDTSQTVLKQMVSLGLLSAEQDAQTVPDIRSDTLAAWLHVTGRCNLRCDYCYLPHTQDDMSVATGYAAIDAIVRSAVTHHYRRIKIKYAGGEPLLLFSRVAEFHRHAQECSRQNGLELVGVVLSNGTLLNASNVSDMRTLGLGLMISMDGIGAYHDCQRSALDGGGSFDEVAAAVELALDQGLVPEISITVSGRSAAGLADLLEWLLERDLAFNINFFREPGKVSTQPDLKLDRAYILDGLRDAFRAIERRLPRRSLLASLVDRSNLAVPHHRPCSVGQSYLVFDSQGRVSKCQMDMGLVVADSSDPDPLSIVRSTGCGIQNVSVDQKQACRECLWRYWCAGGCPLLAYRASGQYSARSPYCDIYKVLYPEAVRLEGLRLLSMQEQPS